MGFNSAFKVLSLLVHHVTSRL